MSRHAKERTNLQKFLSSPFMDLMWALSLGAFFGFAIAYAM